MFMKEGSLQGDELGIKGNADYIYKLDISKRNSGGSARSSTLLKIQGAGFTKKTGDIPPVT